MGPAFAGLRFLVIFEFARSFRSLSGYILAWSELRFLLRGTGRPDGGCWEDLN